MAEKVQPKCPIANMLANNKHVCVYVRYNDVRWFLTLDILAMTVLCCAHSTQLQRLLFSS